MSLRRLDLAGGALANGGWRELMVRHGDGHESVAGFASGGR